MTVWTLYDQYGAPTGEWYGSESDAVQAAEPGQEPDEIEVTAQAVAIRAPELL